jgi:hypothetical protein
MKKAFRLIGVATLSVTCWVAGFAALDLPDNLPFWRVVTGIVMVVLAVLIVANFNSSAQMAKDGE